MSNRVYIIPTRGGAATQVSKDPTAQKAKKKMRQLCIGLFKAEGIRTPGIPINTVLHSLCS